MSSKIFKVGDRVKAVSHSCINPCEYCEYLGKTGTIKEMNYAATKNIWVSPFEGIRQPNGCSGFTAKDLVLASHAKSGNEDEIIYA